MTLLAHKDADGGVQTLRDHLHNAGDLQKTPKKSRKLSSRCLRMMKVRLVLRGPWKCWTLCGSRTTASQGNTLPPKFIVPFPLMWTER